MPDMHTGSFFWSNTGQRNPFYCCPGWLDCRWVKGNLTGNSPVTHWHHIQKERSSHYGNAASGCKHSHAACSRSNHHHLLSLPELSRWLGFRLHAGHNSLSHHLFKQNWSIWTRPLWGWQSDNRTGSLTARLAVWQQNTCSRHIHYAATSGLSHEPWPLYQVQNWSIRTQPLWGWQSDNRTGSLTAGHLQQAHPLHNNLQPQSWTTASLSLYQVQNWSIRTQPLWGWQSDNRTGSQTIGAAVWQQNVCSSQIHYTTTSSLSSGQWRLTARVLGGSLGDLQCKGAFVWRSSIFIIGVVTKKKKEGKFSSTVDLSAGLMSLWGFDESTPVYSLPYEPLWVWWWWWVDA